MLSDTHYVDNGRTFRATQQAERWVQRTHPHAKQQ